MFVVVHQCHNRSYPTHARQRANELALLHTPSHVTLSYSRAPRSLTTMCPAASWTEAWQCLMCWKPSKVARCVTLLEGARVKIGWTCLTCFVFALSTKVKDRGRDKWHEMHFFVLWLWSYKLEVVMNERVWWSRWVPKEFRQVNEENKAIRR